MKHLHHGLQASAHATLRVIKRRNTTTNPQPSPTPKTPANSSGSVPQKQSAQPLTFYHEEKKKLGYLFK